MTNTNPPETLRKPSGDLPETTLRPRRYWLHCIGRQYYPTQESFELEALQHGVTRRIDPRVAKQMQWGDVLVLGYQRKPKAGVTIIGTCVVDVLSGVPHHIAVNEQWGRIVSVGRAVTRGCGTYTHVATVELHRSGPGTDLAAIVQHLIDNKCAKGLMVGGTYLPGLIAVGGHVGYLGVPDVTLVSLKPNRGFRPFDYKGLQHAKLSLGRRVRGGFYPPTTPTPPPSPTHPAPATWGVLHVIDHYQRKGQANDER